MVIHTYVILLRRVSRRQLSMNAAKQGFWVVTLVIVGDDAARWIDDF